jgi:undecaprenyl-diphosphatase
MLELLQSVDNSLFIFFNTFFSTPILDAFFKAITEARTWIIPAIIATVIFVVKEKKKAVIVLVLAIITVAATDLISVRIIKPIFHRLRPCHPDMLIDGCNYLLGKKRSFSFPSSHATNMFGQAMLFTFFYPKKVVYFMAFACLIGFSRIYVGVHYPGDILGGFVFGVLVAWCVYNLYFYIRNLYLKKKKSARATSEPELQIPEQS